MVVNIVCQLDRADIYLGNSLLNKPVQCVVEMRNLHCQWAAWTK